MENFNLKKLMTFIDKLNYTLWGVRITDAKNGPNRTPMMEMIRTLWSKNRQLIFA